MLPDANAGRGPTPRAASGSRSPNYPQLNVSQAIDRISKIYDKEHTHTIPAEVAAEALNYTSLNGTSKSILSALRKYGLLVTSGDGYRVSEDAIAILELPSDDPQRVEAIRKSALRPSAFKLLHDKYGINLPSDGTLRHFLVQSGYQSDGANQVIRFYKETLGFLARLDTEKSAKIAHEEPSVSVDTSYEHQKAEKSQHVSAEVHKSSSPSVPSPAGHLRFHISHNCDVDVAFFGSVTAQAIDKLIKYLELSKDLYPSPSSRHISDLSSSATSTPVNDEDSLFEEDEDDALNS